MSAIEIDAWSNDGMDGLRALWHAGDELEPVLDEATARAEAAEQRAEALAAEVAQARAEGAAAERARIVTYLRLAAEAHGDHAMYTEAERIESGAFVEYAEAVWISVAADGL